MTDYESTDVPAKTRCIIRRTVYHFNCLLIGNMVVKTNMIIRYPKIYRNARFTPNKLLFRQISRALEPPLTDNVYDSTFIKSIYWIIKLLNI